MPADRAANLVDVTVSGATCEATVRCASGPDPSGSGVARTCSIVATREGTCRIEATFRDGSPSFAQDVSFTHYDGCCSGIYADPVGAHFEVPTNNADAGTADVATPGDAASE